MKMIGVRMGQQHGVEPGGAGKEQLLAQIGRGVDQERGTAAFDNGRAGEVSRLYRRDDRPEEDCWVRGAGWCLAYR